MKIHFTLILPAALLLGSCSKTVSLDNNNSNTGGNGSGPMATTFAGTGAA